MADIIYNPPFDEPYLLPLEGDSDLIASLSYHGGLSLVAPLSGVASFTAQITWKAGPGAPPKPPATNSAASLQQFIDALGVGRAASKTVSTHSVVVDPNPPRKPFTPR